MLSAVYEQRVEMETVRCPDDYLWCRKSADASDANDLERPRVPRNAPKIRCLREAVLPLVPRSAGMGLIDMHARVSSAFACGEANVPVAIGKRRVKSG